MTCSMSRFSQSNEDACRLPHGMRRIGYDSDTQRYTFCDHAGQLYQSAPGEEYGVLRPVAAPLAHRRNVTITEIPDPALRQWSRKPAKTFDDILPSGYITAAQSSVESTSPTRLLASPEKLVQAAMPKMQGVVALVRRRTTMKRRAPPVTSTGGGIHRSESLIDESRRLLSEDADDTWEIVRKEDVMGVGRLGRSKSEMRPSRHNYNSHR